MSCLMECVVLPVARRFVSPAFMHVRCSDSYIGVPGKRGAVRNRLLRLKQLKLWSSIPEARGSLEANIRFADLPMPSLTVNDMHFSRSPSTPKHTEIRSFAARPSRSSGFLALQSLRAT